MAELDCQPVTNPEAISTKELKELKKNVSNLDKTEQLEVLKILTASQGKLTENKNGIFINLASISRETYGVITQFVEYSIDNRVRLKNLEKLSEDLFQKSILKKQYDNYEVDDTVSSHDDGCLKTDDRVLASTNNKKPTATSTPARNMYYDEDEFETDPVVNDDAHKLSESLRHDQEPDFTERVEPVSEIKPKISGAKARIMKRCKDLTRNNIDTYYYTVTTGTLNKPGITSHSTPTRVKYHGVEADLDGDGADSETDLNEEGEIYSNNLVTDNFDELTEDIPISE